ncbi:MAG TPA: DNA repair protein RadC [Anaerolineae bacterium]
MKPIRDSSNITPEGEDHDAEYRVLISDIPEGERPRERFISVGPTAMSQRELLAILIRMGPRGVGALALADQLLSEFDGLSGLARANLDELQNVHGIGQVKAIEIQAALELGKRLILSSPDQQRTQIKTPGDAAQRLMLEMGTLEQEEVRTLLLDTRNRVLSAQQIYRGSLNTASMRIAEVFKPAIRANCASIIVAHNHPSGDPAPSAEDVKVTRSLVQAGKLLDIEVLDHIVIAQNRYVSLKERGLGFDDTSSGTTSAE